MGDLKAQEETTSEETTSDEYSKTMQSRMGTSLTYRHEDGMNYARVTPKLIVGSCPQQPEDVNKLHAEGVGLIFNLQQDADMAHFDLDLAPIQKRAAELGIAHVRESIPDFDPFSLRRRMPAVVRRLAQEMQAKPGTLAYIHCTAGLGRAPGTALSYMFWMDGQCLDEAYAQLFKVRRCHPQIGMIRAATCDLLADGDQGSLQETRLAITREGASSVEIAGLDVGWDARLPLDRGAAVGEFALVRQLPPGSYQYKFIVDGEWCSNPDLPTVDDNGNINNVAVVAPAEGSADMERRQRITAQGGRPTEGELERVRAFLQGPSS